MRAVVATRWDEIQVRFASSYFTRVDDELRDRGVDAFELAGPESSKLLDHLPECDEVYVCAHGTGDELLLEGLTVTLDHAHMFSGKTSYFAACRAGSVLGREIGEGGGEFLGFEKDFLFAAESISIPPLESRVAALFLDPMSRAAIIAHERGVIDAARWLSREYLRRVDDAFALGYPEAAALLLYDADSVVAYSCRRRFDPLFLSAILSGGAAAALLLLARPRQRPT